jgi:hypothetical protein
MRPLRSSRPSVLLIGAPRHRHRLAYRTCRSWDRFLARVLAASLDARLAAGQAPESTVLLATRAQALVSPHHRRALAHDWEHLLEVVQVARLRSSPSIRRLPLCRERILAAEPALRDLVTALVRPAPVPATAVAAARLLLSDGAGPLYNGLSPVDLAGVVGYVTDQLDPSAVPVVSP